jgi:hypothetical protein
LDIDVARLVLEHLEAAGRSGTRGGRGDPAPARSQTTGNP